MPLLVGPGDVDDSKTELGQLLECRWAEVQRAAGAAWALVDDLDGDALAVVADLGLLAAVRVAGPSLLGDGSYQFSARVLPSTGSLIRVVLSIGRKR